MRGFLEELIDGLPEDGRCEFIETFAKPYPSLVIAHVMGAPLSDAPRLHHWSNWIQRQFDAGSLSTERELIEAAVTEFYEWADELITARRKEPGVDLITDLITAESEGERLNHDELRNLVLNILVGGVDTSQSQLAHAVRLLAEHPDQWELLRTDPRGLALAAVDEAVRDKDGISAGLRFAELSAVAKAEGRTVWDTLEALARRHGGAHHPHLVVADRRTRWPRAASPPPWPRCGPRRPTRWPPPPSSV